MYRCRWPTIDSSESGWYCNESLYSGLGDESWQVANSRWDVAAPVPGRTADWQSAVALVGNQRTARLFESAD
jgi:hypothetical protein